MNNTKLESQHKMSHLTRLIHEARPLALSSVVMAGRIEAGTGRCGACSIAVFLQGLGLRLRGLMAGTAAPFRGCWRAT